MHPDMPLGMEVGLGPGYIVLHGDPCSLPSKRGTAPHPQFSAHVYCGQTAKWIKMTLAMAVGLGLGHIVPDRPQKEGTAPAPIFDPCQLWPNG